MAVIEFINGSNNTYKGMKRAINYIKNPLKTAEYLTGGKNCSPDIAYEEFVMIKQNFNKENGRQFIHFIQSFSPNDKVTPEIINEIGKKLLEHEVFNDFQVIYATHTDKEHLHTHFIVNSVGFSKGCKWQLSKEQLESLKEHSDELCKEYGLIVVDGEKGKHKNRGEYRATDKKQSWKYELYLAVKHCKWCSRSKDEFIKNMTKLGYKVDWADERKYITFTTPEGKKCRNRKLYPLEQFTKEALFKAFELNKQKADKKQLEAKMELLFTAIEMIAKDKSNNYNSKLPLTALEGQAKKERAIEESKGRGLEWESGKDM
ncbi:relaxase/mobilization nuclease domain-containing protein [Clostridium sp. 19966]|uniref:relaxase/mobilization nuclease domain-containing protein n=1 Tax=Clostridium sp. 19966 TaxID=2768166 RepID=UPI0028DE0483|nr:relaxase/mobilization nuclease domain-containing protein [Clostridium sp. 19966]MDT8716063.1 relaxase/mobilization nuclease domain-containing protein [Clostridium sp. 19966]